MKYIFIFIFLLTSYFSTASDTLEVRNSFAIKTDLIAIAISLFEPPYLSLTVEKGFKKKHALQLTALYAWYNGDYDIDQTIQIVPQYKYYLKGLNQGFFGGFYSKYERYHDKMYAHYDYSNNKITPLGPLEKLEREYIETNIAVGILVGYQRVISKHFCIELIPGIGVRKNIRYETLVWDTTPVHEGEYGMDGMLSLNIGYSF